MQTREMEKRKIKKEREKDEEINTRFESDMYLYAQAELEQLPSFCLNIIV